MHLPASPPARAAGPHTVSVPPAPLLSVQFHHSPQLSHLVSIQHNLRVPPLVWGPSVAFSSLQHNIDSMRATNPAPAHLRALQPCMPSEVPARPRTHHTVLPQGLGRPLLLECSFSYLLVVPLARAQKLPPPGPQPGAGCCPVRPWGTMGLHGSESLRPIRVCFIIPAL